jgi:hypothetical protein
MILVHMPNKLSTTLCMKKGPTYLMVTLAYHAPYPGLLECDEPWLICAGRQIRGAVGLLSVEVLIIIMMV